MKEKERGKNETEKKKERKGVKKKVPKRESNPRPPDCDLPSMLL